MDRVLVGQRLRKLRGSRSIRCVSNDTGIKWSTLDMYELGQRMPGDDKKIILAKYYGKTVQELFFDSDIAESNNRKE